MINEALPGVLGNRGIRQFISGGTREQKSKTERNRGTKAILGNREHTKFIKILILGNKGKCQFFSGKQGNRYLHPCWEGLINLHESYVADLGS